MKILNRICHLFSLHFTLTQVENSPERGVQAVIASELTDGRTGVADRVPGRP